MCLHVRSNRSGPIVPTSHATFKKLASFPIPSCWRRLGVKPGGDMARGQMPTRHITTLYSEDVHRRGSLRSLEWISSIFYEVYKLHSICKFGVLKCMESRLSKCAICIIFANLLWNMCYTASIRSNLYRIILKTFGSSDVFA